jgi:membrane peptidoglycan carboxypeptidase
VTTFETLEQPLVSRPAPADGERDDPPHWPHRALRVLRRAALVAAATVLLLAAVGGVYLLTLPGVGDAGARARAIMVAHGESATSLPTPARLVAATISTEDEHFGDNVVLNVLTGVGRAGLAVVESGSDPGGATIDQQLAKALYGDNGGLLGTLRQIGLGIKLGLRYSGRQILAMYLNVNYYGQGYWGVGQAAAGYFHTTPSALSWPQAAMLAGLLEAPSRDDPIADPALARQRRHHVLDQLVANGYLTPRQAQDANDAPLPLAGGR